MKTTRLQFANLIARGENPRGVTTEEPNGTSHWPVNGPFGASNTPERAMNREQLEKTRPTKRP